MISFTVPGKPVSINATYERRAYQRGGGGLKRTAAAEDYYQRIQLAAAVAFGCRRCLYKGGRVVVEIIPFFTRDADAGAVGKLVQDALQGFAFANDCEVALLADWKGGIDKENPRTEIHVFEVDGPSIALAVPRVTTPDQDKASMRAALVPRARERLNKSRLRPAVHRYGDKG